MQIGEFSFWKWILAKLRNKYFLTLFVFLLWMLIFDSSNWLDILATHRRIRQLEADKMYYIQKIEEDRRKIHELQTSTENLEKFAREQYLMKMPNEDIFIINEDDL